MYISIINIIVSILLVAGIYWFWVSHSCSICHRFYFDKHRFQRCKECKKPFCGDRMTRHEDIEELISGQLGTTRKIIDTREIKFWDYPCGFEFMTTQKNGGLSYIRCYCAIHNPTSRELTHALIEPIVSAQPLRISQTKLRAIRPYIQPAIKKPPSYPIPPKAKYKKP